MTQTKLNEILNLHEMWVNSHHTAGQRADLTGADLAGVDLTGRDLRDANLEGANLTEAKMIKTFLMGANLAKADLRLADLTGALLMRVNLTGANLRGANLIGAQLALSSVAGADLRETTWAGAYVNYIDWTEVKNMPDVPMACPDTGSFIGWKKALITVNTVDELGRRDKGYREVIVKLLIPEDALRSSAIGRKCRCNKATVLAIETLKGEVFEGTAFSHFNCDFVYQVGVTVEEPNFCTERFKECAEGIHFFINRQEAVNYNF